MSSMSMPARTGALLPACLLFALASGCFQANDRFYRDSDIVQDKRIEGRFLFATNEPASLVIKLAEKGHYSATVTEQGKWVELDLVLFKCGTNLFADVSRVADTGLREEPAVGPSALAMLHLATTYHTHSVLRLRFTRNGFEVGWNYGNSVYCALQKHPALKFKAGTETQPIDPHQRILTNPTDELYKLLQTEAANEEIFGFKSRFEKSAK